MSLAMSIGRPRLRPPVAGLARTAELIRADGPLYLLIAAYLLAVLVLSLRLGAIGNLQIAAYLLPFLSATISLLLAVLVARAIVTGIAADPRQPLRPMLAALRGSLTAEIVAGLALSLALALFFGAFTTMKNLLPLLNGFGLERPLADIDRLLHGGRDAWTILQPGFAEPAVLRSAEFLYGALWGMEFMLFTFFMVLFCRDRQLRTRYVLAYLMSWIVLGGVMAGMGLSGGPAFFHHLTGDSERFAALLDMLAAGHGTRFSASGYQAYLWELHVSGRAGFGGGISAFPSMHVAMAGLCAMTAWRLNRGLGIAAWLFAALVLIGSVGLGWHYAIDGYAALIGVAILWRLAGAAQVWIDRTDRLALRPRLG